MLHHIQRTVLDKLANHDSQRYSELKPGELDGNVFGYHLKRLIADKYVSQTSDGSYCLTARGRDFIVHRHEDLTRSAHTIFLIVIKSGTSYLLRNRTVQPLLGYTGFVHGEPEPGLPIIESAQNRLLEKTGIDSVPLAIKGSALITQYKDDELQSYSHAIILYGETHWQEIIIEDETGVNNWGEISEPSLLLPSCYDIITLVENGDSWMERTYRL